MITIDTLTKKYGASTAVDNISFTAKSGRVTGFLGRTVPASRRPCG